MELFGKLSSFKAPIKHSSLTIDNEQDLERVQNVAFKIILKDLNENYENAQLVLDLQTLKEKSFCA